MPLKEVDSDLFVCSVLSKNLSLGDLATDDLSVVQKRI